MTRIPSKGFTVVEILVALAVLAVGLLGAAALLGDGLRQTVEARSRANAAQLSANIAAALRSNREQVATFLAEGDAQSLSELATKSTCSAAPDTAEKLLACWAISVKESLPFGAASITPNAALPNDYIDVTIGWLDRETRSFDDSGDELRRAKTKDECESRNTATRVIRLWSGSLETPDEDQCLIVQRWSVRL